MATKQRTLSRGSPRIILSKSGPKYENKHHSGQIWKASSVPEINSGCEVICPCCTLIFQSERHTNDQLGPADKTCPHNFRQSRPLFQLDQTLGQSRPRAKAGEQHVAARFEWKLPLELSAQNYWNRHQERSCVIPLLRRETEDVQAKVSVRKIA